MVQTTVDGFSYKKSARRIGFATFRTTRQMAHGREKNGRFRREFRHGRQRFSQQSWIFVR